MAISEAEKKAKKKYRSTIISIRFELNKEETYLCKEITEEPHTLAHKVFSEYLKAEKNKNIHENILKTP